MPDFHNINYWFILTEHLLVPLCILLAALIAGIAINRFIRRQITNTLDLDKGTVKYIFINALHGVPISFCVGVGLYWVVNTSGLPESLTKIFSYVLFGVIVFSISRVIARTLSGIIDLRTQQEGSKLPKTSLLTNICTATVYAMGLLVILQYYGISVAPILTALGVGGMALALGLQETLASIFAGVQIILSKPIRVGDYIRMSTGEEGRVTDINWRFTTILTVLGNVVVVPNRNLGTAVITNYSMPRPDITIKVPIGVSYDSDLEQVERVTLEVARMVMEQIDGEIFIEPAIRFHTFAESSIDFNVILHASKFEYQLPLLHEFIKAITKRYREENIEIPFPVRTVVSGDSRQ